MTERPQNSVTPTIVEPLKGPRIVLATYDLTLDLYQAVRSFPKNQQFLLGRRIEETALSILTNLVSANTARAKKTRQDAADENIECLRLLVRLSYDLRFINAARYARLAGRIDEIGRMLGGWRKWAEKEMSNDECRMSKVE